jgi:hypothetical protein
VVGTKLGTVTYKETRHLSRLESVRSWTEFATAAVTVPNVMMTASDASGHKCQYA